MKIKLEHTDKPETPKYVPEEDEGLEKVFAFPVFLKGGSRQSFIIRNLAFSKEKSSYRKYAQQP